MAWECMVLYFWDEVVLCFSVALDSCGSDSVSYAIAQSPDHFPGRPSSKLRPFASEKRPPVKFLSSGRRLGSVATFLLGSDLPDAGPHRSARQANGGSNPVHSQHGHRAPRYQAAWACTSHLQACFSQGRALDIVCLAISYLNSFTVVAGRCSKLTQHLHLAEAGELGVCLSSARAAQVDRLWTGYDAASWQPRPFRSSNLRAFEPEACVCVVFFLV